MQNLGGGLPEDRAECLTTPFGNKPLGDQRCLRNPGQSNLWNCKGALGKTSGRSIFRNAPLRATSSALKRSSSAAIRKTLGAHIQRTNERVAFARCRKTLLAESNNRCIRDRTLSKSVRPSHRRSRLDSGALGISTELTTGTPVTFGMEKSQCDPRPSLGCRFSRPRRRNHFVSVIMPRHRSERAPQPCALSSVG